MADHVQADVESGLRYDADIFPYRQERNPLLTDGKYPVDKNNPAARRLRLQRGWQISYPGASGATTRSCTSGKPRPSRDRRVWQVTIINFPVSQPDPGPSNGRLPTDPMLVNGPVVNRALLNQLYPENCSHETRGRCSWIRPIANCPEQTQVSFGYERQLGATNVWGRLHPQRRPQLDRYDLNPGLRVTMTRTGILIAPTLGLASQLGVSPFANSVNLRA